MAIEPISALMSAQAQGSVTQKVTSAASQEKVSGDVSAATQAAEIDNTIKAIENAKGKGDANNGAEQRTEQPDHEQIKKAVEKLNKSMANSEAVYGIHEGTDRVTIKLVDKDTRKVIKELPPEKTLDMIAKVWELAGLLVDEKR